MLNLFQHPVTSDWILNQVQDDKAGMDQISILLTRIRNAKAVGHRKIEVPYSKMNLAILNILSQKGWAGGVKIENEDNPTEQCISLNIKYKDERREKPYITELKQISKPGRKLYVQAKDIYPVLDGLGVGIYSTSKGVMTDKQAKKEKVGGEYICEVW